MKVISGSDGVVVNPHRLLAGERDEIEPADWFVAGSPIDGTKRSTQVRDKRTGRFRTSYEAIVTKHAWDDEARRSVDRSIRSAEAKVKSGQRKLTEAEFSAFVGFLFSELPQQKRAAIKAGFVVMDDGSRVVSVQDVAAA